MILPEDSIKYKNCAIFKYRKVRFYRENREESREGPFLGQKWGFWGVKMGVFGGFWGVKMGVFGGSKWGFLGGFGGSKWGFLGGNF
jgi:hypothetical protein